MYGAQSVNDKCGLKVPLLADIFDDCHLLINQFRLDLFQNFVDDFAGLYNYSVNTRG